MEGGVLGAKKPAAGVDGGLGSGEKCIFDRLFRWGTASNVEEKGDVMGGNKPCRLGKRGIVVWGFVVDNP